MSPRNDDWRPLMASFEIASDIKDSEIHVIDVMTRAWQTFSTALDQDAKNRVIDWFSAWLLAQAVRS